MFKYVVSVTNNTMFILTPSPNTHTHSPIPPSPHPFFPLDVPPPASVAAPQPTTPAKSRGHIHCGTASTSPWEEDIKLSAGNHLDGTALLLRHFSGIQWYQPSQKASALPRKTDKRSLKSPPPHFTPVHHPQLTIQSSLQLLSCFTHSNKTFITQPQHKAKVVRKCSLLCNQHFLNKWESLSSCRLTTEVTSLWNWRSMDSKVVQARAHTCTQHRAQLPLTSGASSTVLTACSCSTSSSDSLSLPFRRFFLPFLRLLPSLWLLCDFWPSSCMYLSEEDSPVNKVLQVIASSTQNEEDSPVNKALQVILSSQHRMERTALWTKHCKSFSALNTEWRRQPCEQSTASHCQLNTEWRRQPCEQSTISHSQLSTQNGEDSPVNKAL